MDVFTYTRLEKDVTVELCYVVYLWIVLYYCVLGTPI